MGLEDIIISPLTFQATALAARRAGLRVVFREPNADTWSDGTVAAFGLPGWKRPIVDAAAAFGEQVVTDQFMAVFSMHATKLFACGEGGFIVTHDRDEAQELRQMTNFGFLAGGRTEKFDLGFSVSRGTGTNAKLSEYHAAVALASLASYDREPWLRLFDWYEKHLPSNVRCQRRPRGVYPVMAVYLPVPARGVAKRLYDKGIETRRWYTPPLYRHPLFKGDAHRFPVTELLCERLLGLPWHLFLTEADVAEVGMSLSQAIHEEEKTA